MIRPLTDTTSSPQHPGREILGDDRPNHLDLGSNKPRKSETSPVYLNQKELAFRRRISPRTLERWRWRKAGPHYYKLGGKVSYALSDIEAFERRCRAEINPSILGSWR